MKVGCPTCGAEVEFRYDDSFVRICGSCRSAVLRSDRGIETLGKLADLVPIDSPLRLFAEGRYRNVPFLLVGMAQLAHPAGGVWQEWYAKLDGGQWAWVSEAQGRCYVTFERHGVAIPRFEELFPGATMPIGDRWYTVGELGDARYASAAGEIPYRLDPTARFRFADLSDGQGGFATIDYNDGSEPPMLYVGQQVAVGELGLFGGEAPTAAPRVQQGDRLACPSCGGSLELRAPDQTLRVACPYCNHLISVEGGKLAVLGALLRKAKTGIPLGTKGTFLDGELTVIGYMERTAGIEGTWYPFDEYLLYAPGVGFRWLVCSDGHWSYVQPVAPGAVQTSPVRYDGVAFDTFQMAQLRVEKVLGEFYWQVAVGEQVYAADYIAPPAMLSCETSETEQTWSLSTYMTAKEVAAALRLPNLARIPPVGVGPNQPYPLHGVGKIGAAVCIAMCVAGIARVATADRTRKHLEVFSVPGHTPSLEQPASAKLPPLPSENPGADPPAEVPANVAFSKPFMLESGKNIAIELDAPLDNSWLYVAVDLVNEATGAVVSYDANLEYYSGYTDGESWSEGSRDSTQFLSPMELGQYVLRVETQQGSTQPISLTATVTQDVFRPLQWGIAAGVVFGMFGLIAVHAARFRKARWDNSSIGKPSVAWSGGGDDDDDDSSSWSDDD